MPVIPFDPSRPQFVDVSHYHPIVDFAAYAAATGARALGFKVTEGTRPERAASTVLLPPVRTRPPKTVSDIHPRASRRGSIRLLRVRHSASESLIQAGAIIPA
jgi:hypothetical protein